ncbi:MAG: ABC transporter family substrate-binding protein [Actinomycetaceae bacterium]|nr:ABC transporter family substrate-binding protein [Actinomycetaceae bacterium]
MNKKLAAALAVVSLALAACGEAEETHTGAATAGRISDFTEAEYDDLKQGGTVTTAVDEFPAQHIPFHESSSPVSDELWVWYNPQLTLMDPDGTWHYNPAYFDNVRSEEKAGNTVVTYKITSEAVFNDGTPIDIAAFRNTWTALNGSDPSYPVKDIEGYERIVSIEPGASNKEVVVTFDGAYPWWQSLFPYVIHPAIDTPEAFATAYQGQIPAQYGAGPYTIDSADITAGQIVFVPNSAWWGNDGKLDKRIFKTMDDDAAFEGLMQGQLDVADVQDAAALAEAKKASGIDIYRGRKTELSFLVLNSANPILADSQVREAIAASIDRSNLAFVLFKDTEYSEDAPGSMMTMPLRSGYSDNYSKAVRFNQERAANLLEEEGWTEGSNGIREKDGQRLEFVFIIDESDPVAEAQAGAIREDLKGVGINLIVDKRSPSDVAQALDDRQFDIVPLTMDYEDPYGVEYLERFYGTSSTLNVSGTSTFELDTRIADLDKLETVDEQTRRANDIELEAFKRFGVIPLVNGQDTVAAKDGLANMGIMGFASIAVENIGYVK